MRKTRAQCNDFFKVAGQGYNEKPQGSKCFQAMTCHGNTKCIAFLLVVNWGRCQYAEMGTDENLDKLPTHPEGCLMPTSGPTTVFTKPLRLHWPPSWDFNGLILRAGGRHFQFVFQPHFHSNSLPASCMFQ